VDGLERDLKGRAAVLRLDLMSGVGREAASQFGVKAVPTTLVFDGSGQVILRQVGSVDAGAIRTQIADLAAAR
jgi:thioredoxin-related protein